MTSAATANPVLTTLFVGFMHDARYFVASKMAPFFMSGLQSAAYYKWARENALNVPKNIKRAPRTAYSRGVPMLTDDNFYCQEYGHEEPVDDGERKKYAAYFDADRAAIKRVADVFLVKREQAVRDLAATLPGNAPTVHWDDPASNPFEDVEAARKHIHDQTGLECNLMNLPRSVFIALSYHPMVLDRIKYTQKGVITADLIAALFKVDEVVVAGGIENKAPEGLAVDPDQIWGKDVYLAVADGSQDLQAPSFMRTFAWTEETGPDGFQIKTYRDDPINSDVHRGNAYLDYKITADYAGYRIAGAIG